MYYVATLERLKIVDTGADLESTNIEKKGWCALIASYPLSPWVEM